MSPEWLTLFIAEHGWMYVVLIFVLLLILQGGPKGKWQREQEKRKEMAANHAEWVAAGRPKKASWRNPGGWKPSSVKRLEAERLAANERTSEKKD